MKLSCLKWISIFSSLTCKYRTKKIIFLFFVVKISWTNQFSICNIFSSQKPYIQLTIRLCDVWIGCWDLRKTIHSQRLHETCDLIESSEWQQTKLWKGLLRLNGIFGHPLGQNRPNKITYNFVWIHQRDESSLIQKDRVLEGDSYPWHTMRMYRERVAACASVSRDRKRERRKRQDQFQRLFEWIE